MCCPLVVTVREHDAWDEHAAFILRVEVSRIWMWLCCIERAGESTRKKPYEVIKSSYPKQFDCFLNTTIATSRLFLARVGNVIVPSTFNALKSGIRHVHWCSNVDTAEINIALNYINKLLIDLKFRALLLNLLITNRNYNWIEAVDINSEKNARYQSNRIG